MSNYIDNQLTTKIKNNDRFVIYRLPDETDGIFLDLHSPEPFSEKYFDSFPVKDCFVVYPFDKNFSQGWLFSISKSTTTPIQQIAVSNITENTYSLPDLNTGFSEYARQFAEMMEFIKKGYVKKVVLSRIIEFEISVKTHLPYIFNLMCNENPGAFVYLLATPETGIWMGASPELLLRKKENELQTVSLAGTKNLNEMDPAHWTPKEMEEQSIVSDYIDQLFEKTGIKSYKKTGPAITKAGSVTHLKTTYRVTMDSVSGNAGKFIQELHPTPALGGYPKKAALEIIKNIEKHNRSFYGGFLGPVTGYEFNLFVNIRCMNINNDNIKIYSGGGLLNESVLEAEWEETILKSKTLLSAIKRI